MVTTRAEDQLASWARREFVREPLRGIEAFDRPAPAGALRTSSPKDARSSRSASSEVQRRG
jgi:hypothetical protein